MKKTPMPDIIFGRHAFEQCLKEKPDKVEKIWVQQNIRLPGKLHSLIKDAKSNGSVIMYVDRRSLDRMSGAANHQGVILRTSPVERLTLPGWIKKTKQTSNLLVLVLDGVQDPGNLGAIFRSAAAAQVDGIVFPKKGTAPLGSTAMKTSAGALSAVDAIQVTNLRAALSELKKDGFFVLGLSEKAEKSIINTERRGRLAIVVGSEDKGIRPVNRKECDDLISIPMTGPAGSLNVSAAVAVVLYELVRFQITAGREE